MNAFQSAFLGCLAFCLTLAAVGQPTVVQRPLSPDRVTFYTEPNFKGEALTVEAGASVANLDTMMRPSKRPWTFAISSVRVEGAARAIVHTGPDFTGDRLEIVRDIPDLFGERRPKSARGTWDRSIVSISVLGPQPIVATPAVVEPPPTRVYVAPPPPLPPPVREVRPTYTRREADAMIERAYRDVLNRAPDSDGLRHYRERLMREGWSERQLVQTLQRSAEARSINPDESIARLYREILERDPDPNGLAHYRQKWREGWTQGAIREDLRRSKEGREVQIRQTIVSAYSEILGRDPDASGLATYSRLMRENRMSERELRQTLLNSQEYRERNNGGTGEQNRGRRRG
jgi:hypothetical protein